MFNFEKINFSFSYNGIFFLIGFILLAVYAVYMYRYTLPPVNSAKKSILILLRTFALILLLFIIFEPVASIARKIILKPVNLIFIDNSHSIEIKDGTQRSENIKKFIDDLHSNDLISGSEIYTFGSKISPFSYDSLAELNFKEGSTNFSKIFSFIKDLKENISSVSIISDGTITEGANPLFTAEKLNIPVYTVGVGDTTRRNDIEIKNVLHNEFIYAETPTTISATIVNRGFENKPAVLTLSENSNVLEQRDITLSGDGTQTENFIYTPKSGGEKKLTLEVNEHEGEFNLKNNKNIFYINVLSNKIKILVLAGSPSSDLSFIKNSLEEDRNLSVSSLTLITANKFLENTSPSTELDSAGILFLVGFPTNGTSPELLNRVKNIISQKGKPFFILIEDNTDLNKLRYLQPELPFTVNNINNDASSVQAFVQNNENENPLIKNNQTNPVDAWNNLPPVFITNSDIIPKPESEVIVKARLNNVPVNNPLILSARIGSKRSIAVLANNIWRWKLQTATKQMDLFDSFIHNSVKWLQSYEEQKQVSIMTLKKLYSLGEPVEFSGQVYDAAFNPVTDAEVKVRITRDGKTDEILLNSVGNGLYDGTYHTSQTGDFTFNGSAVRENKKLGSDGGSFNIGEVDIEQLNPRMDYEFLSSLSNNTGGKFFYYNEMQDLFPVIKNIQRNASREKIEVSEIRLWSNEWLLIIAIVLFGIEWFIRKQSGML